MLIGALIAHYAYATNGGKEHCACLPDLIIERYFYLAILHIGWHSCCEDCTSLLTAELGLILTESADIDVVGILKDTYLLRSDVAKDADSETRTGEGMASDEMFGHAELTSHTTHLVLKEPLQRFAELQMHLLWQSAHVMMALDNLSGDVKTLYAVGIDGALCEPFCTCYFLWR